MTIEKAAELVRAISNSELKCELFCHFEELLNPYTFDESKDNTDHANWCYMFASLCGYDIARNVEIA